jgi:hypothetical protein
MADIGFRLNDAKSLFFDRPVRSAVDRAKMKVLSKYGAFVRRTARSLIRTRKSATPRGRPPADRTGRLKSTILFVRDPNAESVLIGPYKLNGTGPPGLAYLEENFPFMGPANEKNLPKLPGMWKDSVS